MRPRSRFGWFSSVGSAAFLLMAGPVAVPGCAEQAEKNGRYVGDLQNSRHEVAAAAPASPSVFQSDVAPAAARAQAAAPATPAARAVANRKIIYNTAIDLVTADLNTFEARLTTLIAAQGAYVADSSRTGAAGTARRGTWKVRVPVDAYDSFVVGVKQLGELVSTQAQSQDVSAEYYDLDARTAAKKVEEARLLKHLTDSTGKLDEILTVERELTRVRSEIEQMQGRLAVLGNLTTLATVTITASEVREVAAPPPPLLTPTLGQKIQRTFNDSLATLQGLGEGVLLFLVMLAPWLPLLTIAALVTWLVGRRAVA